MTVAIAQVTSNNQATLNSPSTFVITWSRALTVGSLQLVVGSFRDDTVPTPEAGWTIGFATVDNAGTNNYTVVYYRYTQAGDPLTVTFDAALRSSWNISGWEITGVTGVFSNDVLASHMNAGILVNAGMPYTTASFDTLQANEFVLGVFTFNCPNSVSPTQATTFGTTKTNTNQTFIWGGSPYNFATLGVQDYVAAATTPITATVTGVSAGYYAQYAMVEIANATPPPPPPPPPPVQYPYLGIINLPLYECPYTLPTGVVANNGSIFVTNSQEPLLCHDGFPLGPLVAVAPGPFDYGIMQSSVQMPYSNGFTSYMNTIVFDGTYLKTTVTSNQGGGTLPNIITYYRTPFLAEGALESIQFDYMPQAYEAFDISEPGLGNLYNSDFEPTLAPITLHGLRQSEATFMTDENMFHIYALSSNGPLFDAPGVGLTILGMTSPGENIGPNSAGSLLNYQGAIFSNNNGAYAPNGPLYFPWNALTPIPSYGEGVTYSGVMNIDDTLKAALTFGSYQNALNFYIIYQNGAPFPPNQGRTIFLFCPSLGGYYSLQFYAMTANVQTNVLSSANLQIAYSRAGYFMAIGGGDVIATTARIDLTQNFPVIPPPPVLTLPCFSPCVPNLVMR